MKSYKRKPYKIIEAVIFKNVKVSDTAFKLAKRIGVTWFTAKRVLFYLEDQGKVKLEKDSPHKVLKVSK